jgi:hypothetical protein
MYLAVLGVSGVAIMTTSDEKPNEKMFNGVKVFSATMAKDRERLGERITEWIQEHLEYEIIDMVVTQSSDEAFHCLAFTVFYYVTLD